ncbi:MAG: hypothetical protein HC773_30765 [Scytonema sp. CRU_2_7]|nr:hypothetical protein [Scytonema sp. CRU_2_7]
MDYLVRLGVVKTLEISQWHKRSFIDLLLSLRQFDSLERHPKSLASLLVRTNAHPSVRWQSTLPKCLHHSPFTDSRDG